MALGRRQTFVVALVAAGAAGIGGSLVAAASTSTVDGCVSNTGALRITADPSGFHANGCSTFEHAVSFGQTGPAGPAGPAGAAGPAGPAGPAGAAGANGSAGASGTTATTGSLTNFIAGAAFPMGSRYFVRAELDCPKGDLATGGSATVVSPLGESPAFDGPSPGPTGVGIPNRPAVGWMVEASNTTPKPASLRVTVVCLGPATDPALVVKRLILSRPLHPRKAAKP